MTAGPVLETPRLILRVPIEADLDGWAAMSADAEAMRFIGGVSPRHGAWRTMAMMAGAWGLRGYGMFSLILKETGEWVGRAGPWFPEGWPGPEIGWGLRREYWGQGLAFEAAAVVMDYAADQLGWSEIIHCIDKDNAPSRRLAERLGAAWLREAAPPPPMTGFTWQIYGQSAAAWRARRSAG